MERLDGLKVNGVGHGWFSAISACRAALVDGAALLLRPAELSLGRKACFRC
jgi:hypothetical protein